MMKRPLVWWGASGTWKDWRFRFVNWVFRIFKGVRSR